MVNQLRTIASSVIRPLVTIDAVQSALSDQLPNADTNVLSLSIDDDQQRSRIDLVFENATSISAPTLALMAVQILRRSFGQALGALRIDVYRRVGSEATVLVATLSGIWMAMTYAIVPAASCCTSSDCWPARAWPGASSSDTSPSGSGTSLSTVRG